MSFVLDNSIVLTWCFEGEESVESRAILDRLVSEGAYAPQLWPLEAMNGLLSAERRKRLSKQQLLVLAGFLQALPITLDQETAERAWTSSVDLAERLTLSIYDASYLELAHRMNIPLATADAVLRRGAKKLGVELIGL